MEPSSLPHWAQALFYIVIAIGTAGTGVLSYHKKKVKEGEPQSTASSTASVISASFIDSKLLKELIEAMRELQEEQGRDAEKSHRLSRNLCDAVNELTEATIVQTDTTANLVRFINRESGKHRVVDVKDYQ